MSSKQLAAEVDLEAARQFYGYKTAEDLAYWGNGTVHANVHRLAKAFAAHRITAPTRDGEVGREVQSVWRCAIGDATGALDILKNEWLGSRRKAERHAGQVLSGVLDLVWAARDPAPKNYNEANDSGKRLHALVRAALATQAED